jgi:DNA-binding GntR family transcriptional regulator
MALKDWKIKVEEKDYVVWVKRNNFAVRIIQLNSENKWYVTIETVNPMSILRQKSFKTKSQALAYAKSYMRSH